MILHVESFISEQIIQAFYFSFFLEYNRMVNVIDIMKKFLKQTYQIEISRIILRDYIILI